MTRQIMFFISLLSFQLAHAQHRSANSALNARQQSVVNIAALTAKGTDTLQLKKALINGLSARDSRKSVKRVGESVIQVSAINTMRTSFVLLKTKQ